MSDFTDPLLELDFKQFQIAVKQRYAVNGFLTRAEKVEMNRQVEMRLQDFIDTHGEPRAWEACGLI